VTSSSEIVSNVSTFEKNAIERSIFETVIPTRSTASISGRVAAADVSAVGASHRHSAAMVSATVKGRPEGPPLRAEDSEII
jgi:hypothetical protein